ncbi:MAG: hypothetical protein ACPHWZ_00335 [Longimicrobiales bacterium]
MHTDSGDPTTIAVVARAATSRVGMAEFTAWLDERVSSLRVLWVQEIGARGLGQGRIDGALVDRFARQLVGMLPLMLGPHRDQIRPLWVRGFELFGAVAAKRGLAAGEAIEEVHLLRELVIRDLYKEPPMGGTVSTGRSTGPSLTRASVIRMRSSSNSSKPREVRFCPGRTSPLKSRSSWIRSDPKYA